MPRYTLLGYDGEIVDIVEAATAVQAEHAARARGLSVLVARDWRSEDGGGDALVQDAEARLAEAFGRLGLRGAEVAQAVVGRDGSALERGRRVEVLQEAAGQLRGDGRPAGRYVGTRRLPDDLKVQIVRKDATAPRRPIDQIATQEYGNGGGWDVVTPALRRDAQAKTAATAKALIDSGADPESVYRALGIPVQPKARTTSTPVAAAESARSSDSERVELREVDRLEAALGRAFGLTEVEARHASDGRRR